MLCRTIRGLMKNVLWTPAAVAHLPNINTGYPQELQTSREPAQASTSLSIAARTKLKDKCYHTIDEKWFGERVDTFLAQHYSQWGYDKVRQLVQSGQIYRLKKSGKRRFTRLSDRLELDELLVVPPADQQLGSVEIVDERAASAPSKLILSSRVREKAHQWVLFKNEHVIVINKPSGIPISTKNPGVMSIEGMLPAWKYTSQFRPLICNSLDAETSGIVVLARSRNAHRLLGRMFVRRLVPNNVFWAFCVGKPNVNHGRIRMYLEAKNDSSTIVARPAPTANSHAAIAEFVVNMDVLEFGSFISFYPLTARKFQLRILAAHALRCPIFGDARFGGENAFPHSLSSFWDPENKGIPLHMHHRKIQLPFKNSRGEFICVTAPLPDHMKKTFDKLGWPSDLDDPLIPG